ncbi:MAG: DUF885 domain-containing protein, partial [Bacteroidetes bacterium]|nr:DUF885 domain-containing protein [Bacteroidota bacterium]
MKFVKINILIAFVLIFNSCTHKTGNQSSKEMNPVNTLFAQYYDELMRLTPIEATRHGDNRYNDQLPIDISESFRDTLKLFYQKYLDSLNTYDRTKLNEQDGISYDILKWDLQMALDGLKFSDNLVPINQFWSLTITFGQLGSGESIQPFKTVKDYDDFLKRAGAFTVWCDTAIVNMKRGMAAGFVNPKILMERVLPQLQSMVVTDATQSIFYQPIKKLPADFSFSEKNRLDNLYKKAISEQLIPAYKKLYDFIKDEYIPVCRTAAGIGDLPGGKEYYSYLIKFWTTTDMTADEIFALGQHEVERLRKEMEKIKDETGYKGDLKSFFTFLNTDKKFFPFHAPKEVLDSFENIHSVMMPQLSKLFDAAPKTKFEIR